MEALIKHVDETLELYRKYFAATTDEQNKLATEMTPEDKELTPEEIEINRVNTEKLFYLLMKEWELRGAIMALENVKTHIELPNHAEAIN